MLLVLRQVVTVRHVKEIEEQAQELPHFLLAHVELAQLMMELMFYVKI